MVNVYTQDSIYKLIQNNKDKIHDAKVTSIKVIDFNSMIGHTYIGIVKLILTSGRSKLYRIEFNSTYLGYEDETPQDYLEAWLESCFN